MTTNERVSDTDLAELINYIEMIVDANSEFAQKFDTVNLAALRELAQRRSAGWVKWKPGDALPADGLYWVTRHWEIDGRQMVDTSYAHSTDIDDWEYVRAPVVAYWSEPLPPPFEQEDGKP